MAGKSVQGGVHGTWPGLDVGNLVNGRYLAHTINYRDIMAEILANHLGNPNLATILPGHTPQPIGII